MHIIFDLSGQKVCTEAAQGKHSSIPKFPPRCLRRQYFCIQNLVEETLGSSGQCVSFSLIDVGSGFTAYVVFLFFSFHEPASFLWLPLAAQEVKDL